MAGRSREAGLVGRREQVALVVEAAAQVREGDSRLLIFGGEAGIGKTWLLDHAASRLDEMWVLRGECVELGTEGLPLAPLTAMLRDLVRQVGVDRLLRLVPDAGTVLGLLPELHLPRPDTERAGLHGQARLFELFAALLRRLGAERPVLLVIDDLHWADRSTRELLGFLARTLKDARVLTLAAYRSDAVPPRHPVLAFLAELERLHRVRRVELPRFGRAETEQLVHGVLAGSAPPDLVDRVFRRTGGNPFFIEELVRAPAIGPIPASLRDLLLDRIERLPEPARRVLRVAGVGGPTLPHALLAQVTGMPEHALLTALRAAVDARVLLPAGDQYQFRHALLQEAVLEDLLPPERVRLHRAYAEAIAAHPGLVPPERFAAEVASHWYGAGDTARALPALLEAAAVAERMHAHAEQSQLLVRALEVWPADSGADRIRACEKAATAAFWAGEVRQALALVERVLAEVGDRSATLLAQRAMAKHELGHADALAAVDEALKTVPAAPPLAQARALDVLAAVLMMRHRPEQAQEAATEAARLAAELGEAALETNARITAATALGQRGAYGEALPMLHAARELAERRGDSIRMARALNNLAHLLLTAGRLPETIETARAGIAVAARAGTARSAGAVLTLNLAGALVIAGRWDEADAVLVEALANDPQPRHAAAMHGLRASIALARGDPVRAADQLSLAEALLPDGGPERVSVRHVAAELALAENRLADARAAVDSVMVVLDECDDLGASWLLLVTAARVEALAGLRARTFGEPAEPGRVEALRAMAMGIPADTPLLAAYAGWFAAELDDASWPAVADAWDAVGAPYPAGYARLRAAEVAARQARPAEAGTARWLRDAAGQARAIGATSLLAEIDALARSTGLALNGTPAGEVTDARRLRLTDREVEVLRLIVAGCSNREIAARLFISPKTASVHVSHILAKLEVGNRVEATAVAYRLGLISH